MAKFQDIYSFPEEEAPRLYNATTNPKAPHTEEHCQRDYNVIKDGSVRGGGCLQTNHGLARRSMGWGHNNIKPMGKKERGMNT